MQRLLLAALLLLDVLTGALALVSQCPPEKLPQGNYRRSIPKFLDQLNQAFSKSGASAATVRNLNEPVVYRATSTAELEVLLLHAGSALPSTIGYYIYNSTTNRTQQETDLFPDVNCARVGDTINIGSFPRGTKIGFYLVAPRNLTSRKFWSYQAENSVNPDNLPHFALTYIDQEFVVGFDTYGGDKDFSDMILMIRSADNEPVPVTEGPLRCYEAANLIIIMATLFLGFAAAAITDLMHRRARRRARNAPTPMYKHQLNLCIASAVLFLVAVVLCTAYRIHAAPDVVKWYSLCTMAAISGVVTAVGILLVFIAAFKSSTCCSGGFEKIDPDD